jgi:phospholipase C
VPAHPSRYGHVVWIWMENKSYSSVFGSTSTPYEQSLRDQCGSSTGYSDNMFGGVDLVSEGHYLAAVAGSNCVKGLGKNIGDSGGGSGTGCLWSDADPFSSGCGASSGCPNNNTLSAASIFSQLDAAGMSWRSWSEGMPAPCQFSTSGNYATKHNPAPYMSGLTGGTKPAGGGSSCVANNLGFTAITCSTSSCPTPSNAFTSAIDGGSLPSFSFVTPNACNDTHGGSCSSGSSVGVGDQWLRKYVDRIVNGPNYRSGDTAIFVMWDEGSPNAAQPNIVIAPSIPARGNLTSTLNHFSALKATEAMLGQPLLGCANGVEPGTVNPCPSGSTADMRAIFNF